MSNNRTEATKTAILLLEILHHIPKRGKVSAPEIHQRLQSAGHEITLRSVQRHLQTLCEKFDVECINDSKPYGYRWLPESDTMNLAQLTPQESLLLSLAEQQLTHLLPTKVMNNLKGFFEQAKKNLYTHHPDYPQHQLEKQWLSKIRVVSARQPLIPPELKDGVFEAVSEALYTNRWLTLDYQKLDGTKSTPSVMPLGLAQQGERLYLVCRYKGYDNERSLALHRIQRAKVTNETFKHPRNFSLKKYDDDGRFLFGEGEKTRLWFNVKKDYGSHLYETPLSKDQTITDHGDYLRISATVIDSEALIWWLNGFGDAVWAVVKSK